MKASTTTCALLIFLFLAPIVQAQTQTTYTIPLLGGRWTRYELGVRIPSEPTWAHDGVLDAMTIWNEGQEWFAETYYPNGKTYTLYEANSTQPQITVEYWHSSREGDNGIRIWGQARIRISNGRIQSGVVVGICIYCFRVDSDRKVGVAQIGLHEIGHAFGLGHTGEGTVDLMFPGFDTVSLAVRASLTLPSTLDLHAVHVLAGGKVPAAVALPSTIPYGQMPVSAIPEFPHATTIVLLILGVVLPVVLKRRK